MYNCPKCGALFEAGTKYCSKCGCHMEAEFIIDPICPKCGNLFASGTKFCNLDGSALVSHAGLLHRCGNCGKEYSRDVQYCPLDGGRVITAAHAGAHAASAGNYSSNAASADPASAYTADGPAMYSSNGSYSPASSAVAVTYPKAPLGSRLGAYILDVLFMLLMSLPAIICVAIGFASFYAGNQEYADYEYSYQSSEISGDGLGMLFLGLILLIIPLIYGLIKDGLGKGQSWGKRITGLMVVNLYTNKPCSKGRSALRYIITTLIVCIPYLNLLTMWIEPVMVLAKDDGRKAADIVASTMVIKADDYRPS